MTKPSKSQPPTAVPGASTAPAQVIDAANEDAIINLQDAGTAFITIATDAAWNGTLVVQLSNDSGASWHTTNFRRLNGDATNAAYSTANTTAAFLAGASGALMLRVTNRAAAGGAWVAGVATVTLSAGTGSSAVFQLAGLSGGTAEIGSVFGGSGTFTDRSGAITTGGTSQQVMAANTSRNYLILQNISAENLWFNFGVAAVTDSPSLKLEPGQTFVMEGTFIHVGAMNIIGATTGSKFVSKEG